MRAFAWCGVPFVVLLLRGFLSLSLLPCQCALPCNVANPDGTDATTTLGPPPTSGFSDQASSRTPRTERKNVLLHTQNNAFQTLYIYVSAKSSVPIMTSISTHCLKKPGPPGSANKSSNLSGTNAL